MSESNGQPGYRTVSERSRRAEPVQERYTSTIKWFNAEKGFGFILKPPGFAGDKDIFLHINSLPEGITKIAEGTSVSFNIENVRKGARAINVQLGRM